MKFPRRSARVGVLVGLLVATALFGFVNSGLQPPSPASSPVASQTYGLNYRFYDFFNVPFREYWDVRKSFYGDLPMNAECFSAEGVTEGTCTPTDTNVPDLATYPYAHWYPFVGSTNPDRTSTKPFIYAPYRMNAVGTDVPGYTLQDPVYLPIIKLNEAAGTGPLSIDWRMDYLTVAEASALLAQGCPIQLNFVDGYYLRSQVRVSLDIQESRRLFGVTATDVASARTWWSGNTNPACNTAGSAETSWQDGITSLGGTQFLTGKFDIYNGYEWYYQPFYTNLVGSVANDGTTTVTIDHVAYGTEMLLARMFYWGSAGYQTNYLNSSRRAGWWGMEYPWFEGFHFATTIGATVHSFTLDTAITYHFQNIGNPGPNGLHDKTDDISSWEWGPWLADYVNDYSPKHLLSELDRYPNADDVYVHSTPGSFNYGVASPFDYTPIAWNLAAGESWRFEFPTENVRFYSPTTPAGADPSKGEYLESSTPMGLLRTVPASYGTWDATARTWTVTGPATTGGPAGTPGPDGNPGTPDDLYPLEPWGAITLQPGIPIQASIQAPWTQLYPGQPMTLTVSAVAGGAPLASAAVTATLTGAGSLTPTSGTTDASGKFTTIVQGTTSGTTLGVTANVGKPGYTTGTANIAINVIDPLTMSAVVTSNRREMMSSEIATVRVNLASGSTGVEGALLTPSTPLGGTFSSVRPLGSGNYEVDWTAPTVTRQTFAPINVQAKAGGYLDASGRVVILVDPNKTNIPDPTQLFLLVRAPVTSLRVGQTMTVTVYVYTIEGYVVSGATLVLLRVGPGTVSAVTDRLNGEYTFVYTAPTSVPSPTGVLITITASKLGYADGTARLALTILP